MLNSSMRENGFLVSNFVLVSSDLFITLPPYELAMSNRINYNKESLFCTLRAEGVSIQSEIKKRTEKPISLSVLNIIVPSFPAVSMLPPVLDFRRPSAMLPGRSYGCEPVRFADWHFLREPASQGADWIYPRNIGHPLSFAGYHPTDPVRFLPCEQHHFFVLS